MLFVVVLNNNDNNNITIKQTTTARDTTRKHHQQQQHTRTGVNNITGNNVARSFDVALDMPIDPNEPTYCICQRVSFGEMVGLLLF
jgi:hypothetical protein